MKPLPDQILAAVARDDNTGICRKCGNEQGGTEPDAQHYRCSNCGDFEVFGAEQLLIDADMALLWMRLQMKKASKLKGQ